MRDRRIPWLALRASVKTRDSRLFRRNLPLPGADKDCFSAQMRKHGHNSQTPPRRGAGELPTDGNADQVENVPAWFSEIARGDILVHNIRGRCGLHLRWRVYKMRTVQPARSGWRFSSCCVRVIEVWLSETSNGPWANQRHAGCMCSIRGNSKVGVRSEKVRRLAERKATIC